MFAQTGLDDLCVRFIINLPREELESVERICFQVEEAQWFYEDFIRPLDPALPSLSLKAFALRIFQHCPLMSQWSHYHHITAFSEFLAYKTRVPVRGAIMLNQDMDEVVLVKGWKKGANWSFPRGKINKDEKDLDCAIREVYEETGFDIKEAGLVKDEKDVKFIEITMREQHMRLYVFRGVPRDAHFEPRTRKEISKIEWYKLADLPTLKKSKQVDQGFAAANANKFYMVAPFMYPLKKWIAHQKKLDPKVPTDVKQSLQGEMSMGEALQNNNAGFTPVQVPIGMAAPSDLPEVVASQDASSHLKRLLNINNPVAVHDHQPPVNLAGSSGVDAGKSNALLALLRNGSSNDAVPQVPNNGVAPPYATNIGTAQQQPFPAPTVFPGFPQQGQPTGISGQFTQVPPQPIRPPFPPHLMPPTNIPLADRSLHQGLFGQGGLPGGQLNPLTGYGLSHLPPQQTFPQSHQNGPLRSGPHPFPPSQSQGPAPFQRTGDPQFSHPAEPSQVQGAVVPPASKLPPPKLTSHSLALLNVFKDEASNPSKAHDASAIPTFEQEPLQKRRPSQHQDYLLNLLKGPDHSALGPAELSAQPTTPGGKQILQRPRADGNANKPVRRARKPSAGEGETSATVLGPLDMPQFEAIGRSPGKKKANDRKINKDRNPQAPASPITILPRPQAAERAPSAKTIPQPTQSPQPHTSKAKATEAPKPFQPKILRRSEKPTSGNALPMRTKTDGEAKPEPEPNFPRRPSQTAAQKEALLSLFGKQSLQSNNPPTGQFNIQTSATKPSPASASVSPLSPGNLPSGGPGAAPENDIQSPTGSRVTSPADKAFLLGFLEGVAKGNK